MKRVQRVRTENVAPEAIVNQRVNENVCSEYIYFVWHLTASSYPSHSPTTYVYALIMLAFHRVAGRCNKTVSNPAKVHDIDILNLITRYFLCQSVDNRDLIKKYSGEGSSSSSSSAALSQSMLRFAISVSSRRLSAFVLWDLPSAGSAEEWFARKKLSTPAIANTFCYFTFTLSAATATAPRPFHHGGN